MRRFTRLAGLMAVLALLSGGSGCGGGGSGGGGSSGAAQSTLEFTYAGLPDLGGAFVYEGWLIVGGNPVSTGRFTVDGSGTPSQTSFDVAQSDANAATDFLLTIEPAVGDPATPSNVHLLGGTISAGAARLGIDHADALGTDFSSAGGSYVLAAPTTVKINGMTLDHDYFSGIWFLDPAAPVGPSLSLPALPAGWTYEGWVVVGSVPHSTGKFTDVAAPDMDLGGASSGPLLAPPFPGQDFVQGTILNLRGGAAVISVEPVPDTDPMPFSLKPLMDATINDLGPNGSQRLANQAAANNPSGTLSIDGAALPAVQTEILQLALTGLGELGPTARYEGWLVGASGARSTGVFTIDSTGTPSFSSFAVDAGGVANATDFVVTIEPNPDLDSLPSATKVLAGPFAGKTATLTVADPGAIGTGFLAVTGAYILATPTTPPILTIDVDYRLGIWFLDPTTGPGPGLLLPPLPFGWQYEGWVVPPIGPPFSTGRFDVPGGPDFDGPGVGSGPAPGAAPPFPGQDFIVPPILVPGSTVVISVEPQPDNDIGPFAIKPLIDAATDVGAGAAQPMTNQAATNNPTGTATIK